MSMKKSLSEVISMFGEGVLSVERLSFVWRLSSLSLPACACETLEEGCGGIMKSDGLYTQCKSKVYKEGFCKRCRSSFVEEGMPRLGLWKERCVDGWKTTDGKEGLSWMAYLKKKKMTRSDGEDFLRMKGVNSLPDKEWLVESRKGRGRLRAVSDTSSEGERTTIRFVPLDGKKKSPKKDDSHKGKNGKMLRVCVYQESKVVTKVNPSNWTDEADKKFGEMYCEGRSGENEGREFGKSTKRNKKDAAASQLAEMQAQMDAMKATYEAQLAEAREGKVDETNNVEDKKRKEEAVKKLRAEKKANAEKKAKAESEKKRKAEELKAQLAALEAENDEELGDFDDSDNEGQEFNPFEHNDVTYHRDDEDKLYTEDGDYWGYINDNGEAVEGEEDA